MVGCVSATPIPITGPTVINSPGEYILSQDILDSTALDGIKITSSDVIFDGNWHTIDRLSSSSGVGINVTKNNVTIQNVKVTDWNTGIRLGVNPIGVTNCTVKNTTITGSSKGLYLYLAVSNTIQGNNITKNSLGIELTRSGQCNTYPPTNKNIFFNNFFNNTKDVTFTQYYESCGNSWNTSKTFGKNIVGGPWLGGNYWANYTNTGFSQTCTDTNQDGFCDASYALLSNNIDSIPLTKAPLIQPHAPVAISDTYSTDEECSLSQFLLLVY